ncbi:lipid-A-disaccharide synthase [Sinimarinibacterium sp. CAU 1509]|uniref:lipid-A-disaccharide synthase n=1 Tax=Sinimarinibacterium sp. CAU 1509 TaxID=2562283 RepID=UPI0010ABADF2|nr:lipid-A-disaccharide synthase [Sinimarinibacterium sp. CAU 1509]TJY62093.1 lipid-A-disaccharide synthase [Sinimarinibacterium sp. CAU 1509]
MAQEPQRIALIAGEISGDILGAAIVAALRRKRPDLHCYGVAGPRMIAAGCEAIESIEALSVMGLAEVVRELPRLLRLRRTLVRRFAEERPDVVVGIDAPDFNLGLETQMRRCGIRTVHVVSPTVWAWRQGRVKGIARAVDRMLCLFPFEPAFYADYGVAADYIGHPLAEELVADPDPSPYRRALGLADTGPVVTVMPGSRGGEVRYLAEPFAQTAAWLATRIPGIRFITPVAKPALRAPIEAAIRNSAPGLDWTVVDGESRTAMQAADAVLLASGTATLECLLLGRPMVVAYKASALTAWLMLKLGLLKTRYVSLPNLLCAQPPVTELLQDAATPETMGSELLALLQQPQRRAQQLQQFGAVHAELRRGAAERAADAILAVSSTAVPQRRTR